MAKNEIVVASLVLGLALIGCGSSEAEVDDTGSESTGTSSNPDCECDAGPCCNLDTCKLEPAGTECRASAGGCDLAEVCSGESATCPEDACATSGSCGSGGTCDAACQCILSEEPSGPIGWASENGGTTGGGDASECAPTSLAELNASDCAGGSEPRVVRIGAGVTIQATVATPIRIGSNKTVYGEPGAKLAGQVAIENRSNVIVRDLVVEGFNCNDGAPCGESGSTDAIVVRGSHNLWFDHLEVYDGSDGNMDFTLFGDKTTGKQTDFVTVSWCRFYYTSDRAHRLSNLLGGSNDEPASAGKLRVTFHHNWWGDRVQGRMPYVRYGKVHSFNNLMTAAGNDNGIQVSWDASVLTENNHFIGVKNPIHIATSANDNTSVKSVGNIYESTSGATADLKPEQVFVPPYRYTLEAAASVKASVEAGAGPRW